MRWIACALMLSSLLSASPAARAVLLVLREEKFSEGPILNDIRIEDVLEEIPAPHLKIYPDKNPEHQKLVAILSAGMPFDNANIRDRIAEVLSGYPTACKATMALSLVVGPVGNIDRIVTGVKDKRRVLALFVGHCLAVELPECEYDILDTGDVDFTIGMLMLRIRECRDATNAAVERGYAFHELVYAKAPQYAKAATAGTRNYFRHRDAAHIARLFAPSDADALRFIYSQKQWRECYEYFSHDGSRAQQCLASRRPRLCDVDLADQLERHDGKLRLRRDAPDDGRTPSFGRSFSTPDHWSPSDCTDSSVWKAVQAEILESARSATNTRERIVRDHADFSMARQQIADLRHQVTALAHRGNLEASYFRGCLNTATVDVQDKLVPLPKETDPERPYSCGLYKEDDYRALYINATAENREMVIQSFQKASHSPDAKLAARAHWNLALLSFESAAYPKSNYAEWYIEKAEANGGKLVYDDKEVSVTEFRRLRDRDIKAERSRLDSEGLASLAMAKRLDPVAFAP